MPVTCYIPEHFQEKHRAYEHCNNKITVEHPDICVKIYNRYLLNVGSRNLQSFMLMFKCFFSLISHLIENTVCLNDKAQK
jgi:hypothetical protein